MDLITFLLTDDYVKFLNSINSNCFDKILQIINDEFFLKYNCDYSLVDACMKKIMDRYLNYVIDYKPKSLRNYVSHTNSQYLKSMPCILCRNNSPCEKCGVTTPFDIFKIDTAKNRFAHSCRISKHICLKCHVTH